FLIPPRSRSSTLFPYTSLFRSIFTRYKWFTVYESIYCSTTNCWVTLCFVIVYLGRKNTFVQLLASSEELDSSVSFYGFKYITLNCSDWGNWSQNKIKK